MKLKAVIDSLDGLDEPFHQLYTEKDGKFLLTGIEGVKTNADVERVQRALTAEKDAHKKTKEKFAPFAEYVDDADAVIEKLSGYDDLAARAEGKGKNDAAIIAENAELKKQISIKDRTITKLTGDLDVASKSVSELTAKDKRRLIHDAVRSAAVKTKMLDTAVDDALTLAERVMEVDENGSVTVKDGSGFTPGSTANDWLAEVQPKRPHWWPASVGGGAKGSGGGGGSFAENPWSAENWNLTKQGQVFRTDPKKAERMAEAAGTTIGGKRPAAKK